MIRRHYRDEEPDVDERERYWWTFEDVFADQTCSRCGHSDHRSRDCPNAPPPKARNDGRRSRAEQLAATRPNKPLDR